MRKAGAAAFAILSSLVFTILATLTAPAMADHNEFATDHEIITIDLGDSVISFPKTQDGEPVATNYFDSLAPRGNDWTSYGFTGTKPEPEERKRKVREYFNKWRTDRNGNFKPREISFRFELPLLEEIIKEPERLSWYRKLQQGRKRGVAFRIGNTFPDAEAKLLRLQRSKGFNKWFQETIVGRKPDALDMVDISRDEYRSWLGRYTMPSGLGGDSRVSVLKSDFTPFGQPLVFELGCNPDLYKRPGGYIGFCRVNFYWKVDMFVTYDFDPTKNPRDGWRRQIHDIYDTLRYLEQPK